jgi:hypothetical protein
MRVDRALGDHIAADDLCTVLAANRLLQEPQAAAVGRQVARSTTALCRPQPICPCLLLLVRSLQAVTINSTCWPLPGRLCRPGDAGSSLAWKPASFLSLTYSTSKGSHLQSCCIALTVMLLETRERHTLLGGLSRKGPAPPLR